MSDPTTWPKEKRWKHAEQQIDDVPKGYKNNAFYVGSTLFDAETGKAIKSDRPTDSQRGGCSPVLSVLAILVAVGVCLVLSTAVYLIDSSDNGRVETVQPSPVPDSQGVEVNVYVYQDNEPANVSDTRRFCFYKDGRPFVLNLLPGETYSSLTGPFAIEFDDRFNTDSSGCAVVSYETAVAWLNEGNRDWGVLAASGRDICVKLSNDNGRVETSEYGCDSLEWSSSESTTVPQSVWHVYAEGENPEGYVGVFAEGKPRILLNWRAITYGPEGNPAGRDISEWTVYDEEMDRHETLDTILFIERHWVLVDTSGAIWFPEVCDRFMDDGTTLNEYGRTQWQQDCYNNMTWLMVCNDFPDSPDCDAVREAGWID